MKNTITLFFIIVYTLASSQKTPLQDHIEAQMKSAFNLQNFVTNPNTHNYDVKNTELFFEIDPAQHFIKGKVVMHFTALENLNEIYLDLADNLTVEQVLFQNSAINFDQLTTDELKCTLTQNLQAGDQESITIQYQGAPVIGSSGFGSFSTGQHNGTPVLWTLSEPYGARDWWPCKQDLTDKIEQLDVHITTPDQYTGVSNGVKISETLSNGKKTIHYRHKHPIPTYLVAIAATNYTIYEQQAGSTPNTFPIVNYLYPETYDDSVQKLGVTTQIMDFFESEIQIYPYYNEKYGHAQFGWGGGMEHTTVSFMGNFSRHLIAHELAHQWFGDKITCGSWNDIWINEGFAEYYAGMVNKHLDGDQAFIDWKKVKIDHITSSPDGSVYVPENLLDNVGRIFSWRLTYNKGAMVVHMLKWIMGDQAFKQAVNNLLNDPTIAFGYVKTSNVKAHFEAVYGASLDDFFHQWVYSEGYPSYRVEATKLSKCKVRLTIDQTTSHQSVEYFTNPVEIKFANQHNQSVSKIVSPDQNHYTTVVDIPIDFDQIIVDPNYHLISKNNTTLISYDPSKNEDTIKSYPIPSDGMIFINIPCDQTLLQSNLYNLRGQKVLTTKQTNFNISNLAQGIYYLRVETLSKTEFISIIKY